MFEKLFSRQGLSMDRLRNFLLVVDSGSIAEAADREPSKQSLLSRQIRELETFFEVELTRRSGKTIEITEAGQDLARVLRRSFTELEDYLLRQIQGKRLLKVGAGYSTMQWILTPNSVELAKQLDSELEMVRMRSRDATEWLRKGLIDFAAVRRDAVNEADSTLLVHAIGKCGYALFGKKGAQLPLAIPSGGGQFEKVVLEALGDSYPNRIRCGSLLQMTSLVIAEQACAILPKVASVMFRRMDWIESKEFTPTEHYTREWVVAASKRQMEARGVSETQLKHCADLLTIRAM